MNTRIQTIPNGYKLTEKGIIPNDWEILKLGQLADVTKLAGFEYSKYFNSYKDTGEIIVIRGTNITHNKLDLSDVKTIPVKTSNKLQRSKLSKGDLVFAYVGTIGPVYLVDKDNKFHLGPNTSKITAHDSISPEYLYTYFDSEYIHSEITEHTSIGAQPSLSMTKIRKFKIITPSDRNEQNRIAAIITDLDSLIQKTEKLIAKKKAIKQGAMQELLTGKRRFPGFSGEWEVKRLDQLFSITAGRDLVKEAFSDNMDVTHKYPIYSNSLQKKGLYGYTSLPRYDDNCVTVTARGTIGVANSRSQRFDAIGRLLILKPIRDLDCSFMSEYINNRVNFSIESTGVPQLTAPQISTYEVIYPKPKEQTAIANILADMDFEIDKLEKKLEKYNHIKQGAMQVLLTGKIRLIKN